MKIIADLHFHSKYSRAVSPQMVLPEIAKWAKLKGIDLLTTTDFTHPLWLREIKANLEEAGEGVYRLKGQSQGPLFICTTEVSSIYTQGGKLRRIHNLIFAPSLGEAEKIGAELARRGNVFSDGRPIFGLSAREVADLVLNLSPDSLIIPAHAWTPHFSLYGSESGFDSLEECFGEMAKYIYAVETGLSSDPAMNWRIEELDKRSIISCSDAHSGAKLGREATVFEIEDIKTVPAGRQELRYGDIKKAIQQSSPAKRDLASPDNSAIQQLPRISYTIEFYPEEGKYHYTGHRNCQVKHSPEETKRLGETCPVCGRHLTIGVMHRVQRLASRDIKNEELQIKNNEQGVKWIGYGERPPYAMLVPLLEILAESLGTTVGSQKAINEYNNLTLNFGGEFGVLLNAELVEMGKVAGPKIAEAIKKVRAGDIAVEPGYDGVFGVVKIWGKPPEPGEEKTQMALF